MYHPARALAALASLALTGSLLGCSTMGGDDDKSADESGSGSTTVKLVTHDSFALPEDLQAKFEKDSGLQLEILASGDAGAVTNKLVLTKDSPIGDVAFGVDNTFASRPVDEGVFEEYAAKLPAGADQYVLEDIGDHLTPIDNANVCVNIDTGYFEKLKLPEPETLDDLAKPVYRGRFVVPGAATSSPGMAFLLTTIAEYGDDWPAYWAKLMDNDTLLVDGWESAYQGEFSQGGGKGKRPIVLSYDTSPAFTVDEAGTSSTTKALLHTCFPQTEYAGVLAGADNPEGARALIDFLLSPEVQAALPDSMYVFPVDENVELPATWAKFAVQPTDPHTVDPAEIAENREQWLTEWRDVTTR
ncbi:thiamine ABC transporter substrate-binding protein [Nocardioides speluncae]|uniref:thiamine ABC transporter substrate-binding protein n=1 Tax=Nocardioides speluncae TaxID=2670337 RepID=UPI000D68C655|nr:thiamine ABC transporter substrate-binding protein [Nocardioides speluncae]